MIRERQQFDGIIKDFQKENANLRRTKVAYEKTKPSLLLGSYDIDDKLVAKASRISDLTYENTHQAVEIKALRQEIDRVRADSEKTEEDRLKGRQLAAKFEEEVKRLIGSSQPAME